MVQIFDWPIHISFRLQLHNKDFMISKMFVKRQLFAKYYDQKKYFYIENILMIAGPPPTSAITVEDKQTSE